MLRQNRHKIQTRLKTPSAYHSFTVLNFLPAPTAVAGVGCYPLSVCFSAWYLKKRCSYDYQTWRTNVPRWVLETHLFWGLKVKCHELNGVGLCTLVSVGFF